VGGGRTPTDLANEEREKENGPISLMEGKSSEGALTCPGSKRKVLSDRVALKKTQTGFRGKKRRREKAEACRGKTGGTPCLQGERGTRNRAGLFKTEPAETAH